jgi:hypothetical protein
VHDDRELETTQGVKGALDTSRGKTYGFARAGQAVQRRALGGDVGQLSQLSQGHPDSVVFADHRETRGAAIHLLGLLDPGEAADDILTQLGPGFQVDNQLGAAQLGDLHLPLQLAIVDPDPLLQRVAHLRIALQDEMHGLLGNDENGGIRVGYDRRALLLPHQAGAFTEGFPFAQGG